MVSKLGLPFLEALNSGSMTGKRMGGSVGRLGTVSSNMGAANMSNVNIQIIDQSRGVDVETETETDENGMVQIKAIIKEQVREDMRRGEFDRDMNARFGLKARGSMR
jgi:hypothetical protein